jgi:hypothetical protein
MGGAEGQGKKNIGSLFEEATHLRAKVDLSTPVVLTTHVPGQPIGVPTPEMARFVSFLDEKETRAQGEDEVFLHKLN